jgi:putative ABC transport system permease protein
MILDSLQEIFYSLKSNKLRTSLTAFGVFWGIFMLVLLLGAGTGLKRGIEKSFSSDVRNSIWINAFSTSVPYKGLPNGRKIQLTEADLVAIHQEIPGVDLLSAENPLGSAFRASIRVTYENHAGTFGVFGVAKDYFKIKRYQDYQLGRRLNNLDEEEGRKVAVIGTRVKDRLFGANHPLGKLIIVKGVTFTVVGVFYDSGWEGRMSERIYIPLSTFQNAFGGGENISIIALTPKVGVIGADISPHVEALIKRRHNVAPSDRKAIFVTDLAQQSAQVNNTINAINVFIWFVGLGTLAAGIVGISNIMMITVKERTLEIGIRKALGAPPWRIVSTILTEAVLVTGIAGYAGLVCAVGLLECVNYTLMHFNIELNYFTQPEVNFNLAISALVILLVFGLMAGFFPARRAARVSPIEAMRAQ